MSEIPSLTASAKSSSKPAEKAPANRLEAISKGAAFDSVIHKSLLTEDPIVEVQNFNLWYGPKQALFNINMRFPRNKVTAIIGPSGCGKSTLLRCINRMNDLIDTVKIEGDMRLSGDSIYGKGVDVIELRKRMGMVFQKPNPFPMSIFDNVVYPLKIDGERNRQIIKAVAEQSLQGAALWEEVQARLRDSALSLSGGQQQRLCIARAIAGEPEVLLLDEPCSALDPIATNKVEDLVRELRGDYSIVIVTHNMQQASRVSDRTAFFTMGEDRAGYLVEADDTVRIFTNPREQLTEDYISGRFG